MHTSAYPYYDSAADTTITRARALRELAQHGVIGTTDFDAEVGIRDQYTAHEVLNWLGY